MMDDISLDQVRDDIKYDLVVLYDDNMDIEEDNDSPFRNSVCEFYEPGQFSGHIGKQGDYTSYFHITGTNRSHVSVIFEQRNMRCGTFR